MIDDIKILLDAVSSMDNGALYVVILVIAYKLITKLAFVSAIFFLFRLFIIKAYKWGTFDENNRPQIHVYQLGEKVIGRARNYYDLANILLKIQRRKDGMKLNYLHEEDIEAVDAAISQYIQNTNKKG